MAMPANLAAEFLNIKHGHISVPIKPLSDAQVLWVNPRAALLDPAWARVGGEREYERHLLRQCAFSINPEGSNDEADCLVDRYGGIGIGSNGGSGRAAVLNGYHVKGVGKTPLIGHNVDRVHSTGTCELEESIREAIIAECIAAEFPHGAVPVLAIIGTGQHQERIAEAGIGTDGVTSPAAPLCLTVRPLFVRPAHFQRAARFVLAGPRPGLADRNRVQATVETGLNLWGAHGLTDRLRNLYQRWSQQLAYGYVHRVCHGGCSPSNITLDGALLDFGATAALPDWGRAVTLHCGPEAGREFPLMLSTLADVLKQVAKHCPDVDLQPADVAALEHAALHTFTEQVQIELLRVLGLSRRQAQRVLLSPQRDAVAVGLNRLVRKDARRCYTTFEATPGPREDWLADGFWEGSLDTVCGPLRELLSNLLCRPESRASAWPLPLVVAKSRNRERARTRTPAFREVLRHTLQRAMSDAQDGQGQMRQRISTFIGEQVLAMRRDSRAEPVGVAAIGYGWGVRGSCTIYRCLDTAGVFAVSDEMDHVRSTLGGSRYCMPAAVQHLAMQDTGTVPHAEFGQVHWLPEASRLSRSVDSV